MTVFGIGDGIFVIAIVALLSLCLCFFGAKTRHPGFFCCLGVVLTVGFVLFFVYMPRAKSNQAPTEQDPTYVRRVLTFLLLCFAIIFACCVMGTSLFVSPIQGHKVQHDPV